MKNCNGNLVAGMVMVTIVATVAGISYCLRHIVTVIGNCVKHMASAGIFE